MAPSTAAPPVWLVRGHRAALAYCPLDDLYVACVPALAGCSARGASRAEALARLAARLEAWTAASPRADGLPVA